MQPVFAGVYPMLLSFYTGDDRIDATLLRRQVDLAVASGCHGLGVMGLGTEVNKLSTVERRETLEIVAQHLAGRLPLSVTIGENTARGQIEFARHAAELNAAWLILQPPAVSDVSELELLRFFGAVADSVSLPVALQNAAVYLGIQLSTAGLRALQRQHPNVCLLKTEDPPEITARLIEETGGTFRVFVGRGGMNMIDELRAGAVGIIPGVETMDRMPGIYNDFVAGRDHAALAIYSEIAPSLEFLERSINHFVTCSREIMARRMGVPAIHHRLAKEITPFCREQIDRYAAALGPFAPARGPAKGASTK
ncbi:MAG TPA: dihydrodipicolinate synthase family protein [Pirellulales bacterium]|jgi:4-hydroxy-tetrahydrodipicolinate synthase